MLAVSLQCSSRLSLSGVLVVVKAKGVPLTAPNLSEVYAILRAYFMQGVVMSKRGYIYIYIY